MLARGWGASLTLSRFTELETYVSPSVVKMLVGNKLDKVMVLHYITVANNSPRNP
jgi:hypothetical protein